MKIAYLILLLCSPISAQVSESDLNQMIAYYKTHTLGSMPPPVTDPAFRKSIHDGLPQAITGRILKNQLLKNAVLDFLKPVVGDRPYDLIIFDSPIPIAMSDSGVVLVFSTGMIQRAQSDDELLGYTAHELAHEYYAKYSVYSRYLLTLVRKEGNEPVLSEHLRKFLSLIELQCDAFAALKLNELGYDPIAFIDGLELSANDFPDVRSGNHPPLTQRRALVLALTNKSQRSRQDSAVNKIKQILSTIRK